jgi:uncharacterized protein with PIN domain
MDEPPRFIVDKGLFPICKTLRMLGFDVVDRRSMPLKEAVGRAIEEKRIWIRRSLETPALQYGIRYFLIQSDETEQQLKEIEAEYHLRDHKQPFSRCLRCNEILREVDLSEVVEQVPDKVRKTQTRFYRCDHCRRIYWPGSHLQRMKKRLQEMGWETDR